MRFFVLMLFLFSVFFIPHYAMAAPTTEWLETVDVDDRDTPVDNAVDSSGNVFMLGLSSTSDWSIRDTVLVKHNPRSGRALWAKRMDFGDNDTPVNLAIDSSDDVLMAVQAKSASSVKFATAKYDGKSGQQQWFSNYSVPLWGGSQELAGMGTDSSGNVYIAGHTWDETTSEVRFTTVKYDANGTELWVRKYDHCSWNNKLVTMTVDSAGNVYLAGDSHLCGGSRIEVVKYDTDGNISWDTQITKDPLKNTLHAGKIHVDSTSGNVYISALEEGNDFGGVKAILLNGSTGAELASDSHDFSYYLWSFDLDSELDSNGNILIAANIKDYNTNSYDILTLKFSNVGVKEWVSLLYDSGNDDELTDLEVDSLGNAYVTSWNEDTEGEGVMVKYSADLGGFIWTETYGADAWNSFDTLAIDASDNLYVSGVSYGATYYDYLTIKYSCPGDC